MQREASQYFDAQADTYQRRSQQGAWRFVRRFERAAVFDLLADGCRGRVLELGCGAGYYSRLLGDEGPAELVCADVSPRMLEQLRGVGCERLQADMENLVLDREFDCILAAGSLEFVAHPERVLANARRMLAPGGVFVGLVPAEGWGGRIYAGFHRRHGLAVRLFDRPGVERLAEAAGLSMEKSRRCGLFSLAFRLRCV